MKRITRFRLYFAWDFDSEEKWINRLSEKGWQLESVGPGRYTFVSGVPREYIYRLELMKKTGRDESQKQYLRRLEAGGAVKVAEGGQWAYYRKSRRDGDFAIYKSEESKLRYLRGVARLYAFVGIAVYAAFALEMLLHKGCTGAGDIVSMAITALAALIYTVGLTRLTAATRRLERELGK